MYIFIFFLTIFFAFIYEKINKKNNNKLLNILLKCLIILIPSILAGLRSENIGIDLQVYVEPIFYRALAYNNLFDCLSGVNTEFLYGLLNYLVTRVTSNLNVLLFVVEIINMYCIVSFLDSKKDKVSFSLGLAVYLFFFYNVSLNLVRQSLAISILFLGMKNLGKSNIRFFISVLVASLFHVTAILSAPIFLIYKAVENDLSKVKKIVIIVLLVFSILFYKDLVELLVYSGVLSRKYLRYITIYNRSSYDFNYSSSLFRGVWIILAYLYYGKLVKINNENNFYIYLLLVDLVLSQIGNFSEFADRITYYYGLSALVIVVPQTINCFSNESFNKTLAVILIFIVLIFYWYFIFVHFNTGETVPYEPISVEEIKWKS